MTVRDEVHQLVDTLADARLDDVRALLKTLQDADAAWDDWAGRYGSKALDARVREAVLEADTDPRPSVPDEVVSAWLRSWGDEEELPPPLKR